MLRLKTHKLYYNKWPYKIECRIKGASNIHRLGPVRTKNWLIGDSRDDFTWRGCDKDQISLFVTAFSPFIGKDLKVRTEGSHYNIFVKDTVLAENIIKAMDNWIHCITAPGTDEEYEFLINNNTKKILCENLPHGMYHYKMHLSPSMPPESRERFYNWTTNYGEKIDIAKSTTRWLTGDQKWAYAPFLYIEDSQTLCMAGLYLGNNIKRVEEFIPRIKINT
jgi:hypothetical protein